MALPVGGLEEKIGTGRNKRVTDVWRLDFFFFFLTPRAGQYSPVASTKYLYMSRSVVNMSTAVLGDAKKTDEAGWLSVV